MMQCTVCDKQTSTKRKIKCKCDKLVCFECRTDLKARSCAVPGCKARVEATCDACGECESCANHFSGLHTCVACGRTTCDDCMADYTPCRGCLVDFGCVHCGSCINSEPGSDCNCTYDQEKRSDIADAIFLEKRDLDEFNEKFCEYHPPTDGKDVTASQELNLTQSQ